MTATMRITIYCSEVAGSTIDHLSTTVPLSGGSPVPQLSQAGK